MKTEMLRKAMELYQKKGYAFLATASAGGVPHIAAAGKIELVAPDTISITEWFCPCTVGNLNENPSLCLVLWDWSRDQGLQLLGTAQHLEDTAILDGFAAEESIRQPLPQVQWKLLMRVNKMLDFTRAPHNDVAYED